MLRKRRSRLSSRIALVLCAGMLTLAGCSSGAGKTDPGTLAGTYNVTVTATGLSGAAPYTTVLTVPITVH